jgi:hypothetical protein
VGKKQLNCCNCLDLDDHELHAAATCNCLGLAELEACALVALFPAQESLRL